MAAKDASVEDVSDDFRAIIRARANESGKTISQLIHFTFDRRAVEEDGAKLLSFSAFELGVRSLQTNFSRSDIEEIFEECGVDDRKKISVDALLEFCQKTFYKARTLALRLRNSVKTTYKNEESLRKVFSTMAGTSTFVEVDNFRDFADDYLENPMNENDALAVYGLFDIDNDGKVSIEDFLGFILNPTNDANKALKSANEEAIIDIRVSDNRVQEAELKSQGYIQIIPDIIKSQRTVDAAQAVGSFGRGQGLWIWRRKQGTCCGRLKSVIDIQLDKASSSSALVLSGYTCLSPSISGQYVWIKRATNEDEEKDVIIELHITVGKMKNPVDSIWSGPGIGWIRVEGNFSKGFMSSQDSFLWFLPARTRSMDHHLSSPIRSAVVMSDEARRYNMIISIRTALRNYIPIEEMKRVADFVYPEVGGGSLTHVVRSQAQTNTTSASVVDSRDRDISMRRIFDFSALYHKYDLQGNGLLSKSAMQKLFRDIGICIEKTDLNRCFQFFDLNQNAGVSREEYNHALALTDYELDIIVESVRRKLQNSIRGVSSLKHNRTLSELFYVVNENGDGVLSLSELLNMMSKLEFYLSEEEGRRVLKLMDLDGDDRIEERDFIAFMKKTEDSVVRKAHRLREAAAIFRRWLLRGSSQLGVSTSVKQWKEIKKRYEKTTGAKFPGYLSSLDLMMHLNVLGLSLSPLESRQLCLLIAPEKNGHIQQPELHEFMGRSCRSFGVLLAMLDRDILKPVMDVFKAHREAILSSDGEDPELSTEFKAMLVDISRAILDVGINDKKDKAGTKGTSEEVVSVAQTKRGIEIIMSGYTTPAHLMPNLEEWAALACLADACIAEDENYGILVHKIVENLCVIVAGSTNMDKYEEVMTVDMVKKELQRMILEEALSAGGGRQRDYAAAFALFDPDRNGMISLDELRQMLVRLQLVDQLAEGQLPVLLAQIDKKKRGYITLESMIEFAEEFIADNDDYGDALDDDDSDDDDDDVHLNAVTPPVVITEKADCDWLLWFIWKQCCKTEPRDPESLITELQACCAESEITHSADVIMAKELWILLAELKIRGDMTRAQFDKGIQHMCYAKDDVDADKKKSGSYVDTLQVDYESFCRYIVRMGRAFNTKLQERRKVDEQRFKEQWAVLQKELLSMGYSAGSDGRSKGGPLRFEKIFKRMDSDGDGHLTVLEFKKGLKRLRCRQEKKWSLRMIRRLFDERGGGRDGVLLLADLSALIRGGIGEDAQGQNKDGGREREEGAGSDDDGEIFGKYRLIGDTELMKKVALCLMDSVPRSDNKGEDHLDTIRQAIRRYFSRPDPDKRGVVSEDRFRSFLRRSGLQERLPAHQIRRLLERLRRRVVIKSGSDEGGPMIDYERFCRLLVYPDGGQTGKTSIPLSKAEGILAKLQEAAAVSANCGRPFHGLCTLVDPKLTGFITVNELCLTCKMMGYAITPDEVNALKELLPEHAVVENTSLDYREINWLIHHYMPVTDRENAGKMHRGPAMGTLPYYTAPNMSFLPENNRPYDFSKSIMTPGGYYIMTPGDKEDTVKKEETKKERDYNYDKWVRSLSSKIRLAVNEKSRLWGYHFSLRRQFQVTDSNKDGWIPLNTFQSSMEELGVELSSGELQVVRSQFGRGEDDQICYGEFCEVLLGEGLQELSEREINQPRMSSSVTMIGGGGGGMSKLQEVLREVKEVFRSYDRAGQGWVDQQRFREVIKHFRLINNEHQLFRACDDFACVTDRSLVCYEDFLSEYSQIYGHSDIPSRRNSFNNMARSSYGFGNRYHDNDNNDNTTAAYSMHGPSTYLDRWYLEEASPKKRREFDRVNESLQRFKSDLTRGMEDDYLRRGNLRVETGSDGGGDFYPPKPSDSISFNPNYGGRRGASPSRAIAEASYYDDYSLHTPRVSSSANGINKARPNINRDIFGANTPRRSMASPPRVHTAPRSPPSKVGAGMWGIDTPLTKKGYVPQQPGDKWCCGVCYYTENIETNKLCEVCDSPNYAKDKDYQMKLQCNNCTFLNGHFALQCEMCGVALKGKGKR